MNKPTSRFRSAKGWEHLFSCALLAIILTVPTLRAQQTGLGNAVSSWLFDEGMGSTAENAVDATYNGNIVDHRNWVTGMYGMALSFDGDYDAVEVPSNPLIGAHALTVQAYIKPASIPDEESSKIFNIALERATEGVDRFMLDILPSEDFSQWVLSHFMSIAAVVTDPEDVLMESGTFHPFNQWYHVALVFDSINDDSVAIRHYVNHVLEYETQYALDTLAQGEVFIGERYAPKGIEQIRNYFDGAMDNLVLHDYALTVEEFMPAPGMAAFDADPTTGPAPLEVSFSNGSPSDVTDWDWDFGDGQTSTESDPVHTYAEAGVYSVTLIVTAPAGPDTLVKPDFIEVTGSGVGIAGESPDHPSGFHLAQNYPNPFNPVTQIEYSLDRSQDVDLSIYNLNGHLVRCLDKGYRSAGTHVCLWDGRDERGLRMQSGIYLCSLESGTGYRLVKKAILLK